MTEVEGAINGCPTQVIVQHFAGYIPPNYSPTEIDSWKKLLDNLRQIQPEWAALKNYNSFYQAHKADVDRINATIARRIVIAETIYKKLSANQWLTAQEENMVKEDEALGNEENALANKLNSF